MYFYKGKNQEMYLSNTPRGALYKPFFPPKKQGAGKRDGDKKTRQGDKALHRYIREVAHRFGMDPKLIEAVIHAESNFDPQAVSPAGAIGLMQLMPETAREMGVVNSRDPFQNITGGTRYLSRLLANFKGDTRLALAAYNAGIGPVKRYGSIPPYAETRHYVQRVLAKRARQARHENRVYRTVLRDGTLLLSDQPYRGR